MSILIDHVSGNISASSGSLSVNNTVPQPVNSVLTSISDISTSTTGLLKLTNGVSSLDTSAYLTANQTITFSGDASGSGNTSVTLTLANSGVTVGTYTKVTVDAKGRVTVGANPNTISGYGITDAQPLNANLTSVAGLSAASTGLVKLTNGVASFDTNTYLTSVPTASASVLGVVKVDGNTISIDANGVISGASSFSLTPATASNLGGVKVGANLAVDGTGVLSLSTTPSLGTATATSINKVAITAPATGSTLTIANGKTLTANNTLTFTGTDSSSVAFGAGGTVIYASNNLSALSPTTSTQLAGVISDETGSGSLVFGTSPTITTSLVSGSASFDLLNTTATSISFGGAATSLSIGAGSGTTTINNDLAISGSLTISGSTTTINSTNLELSDSLIYLAKGNSANLNDIGIVGHFTSGSYQHTGFVKDASDGYWKLFSGVATEPNTVIDFTTWTKDSLKLGVVDATSVVLNGATSGAITVIATSTAGTNTLTLPAATDTLVGKNTTDTLTNKTLTSPVLTTPSLGVATATSINKVTITAPTTGSTLTVADGKTLTANNTLTFTGTDGSSVAFGAGGTVLYNNGALGTPTSLTLTNATGLPVSTGISGLGTGVATFLATPSSVNLASAITDETGSGSLVFGTGPTIDTPRITTELRINNTANTYYVGFKAGTISANKIWTLPTADGTSNQVLKTDGTGNLGWMDPTVAAGSNTQIQFNNSGALGASSSLTWDGTNLNAPFLVSTNSTGAEGGEIRLALAATGNTLTSSVTIDIYQNKLRFYETGGINRGAYIDLASATTGVGSNLLSSANISYGTGVTTWLGTPTSANLATAVTDETGSGSLVFATSPTLVSPLLGTPTSGVLSNCTGYTYANLSGTVPTWNQSTTGSAATLTTARNLTISGDASWTVSFNGSADVSAALTLANVVTAGTGTKLTYNAKGLITGSSSLTVSDISNISTTYQGLNANLTSLAALSTATTGLVKLTNGTASLDTSSYLVSGGALGTPTSGDLSNATNAVAYGIKTATNTVSVSAAPAPTIGQALVATSATTATWQTVSSGGGSSLPSQTGNTGKYLTTDGTNATWAVVSGGLTSTAVRTSAYTAVSYDLVRCNSTSGSFTVTFPTSPADGAQIGIIDIAKTFGSYPITVTPGLGTTIEGDNTGVLLDINGTFAAFVYTSSLTNWRLMNIPTTTNAAYNNGTLYPTLVKTSAYSASSNEIVRCNTSGGAFSVTFPSSPLDGAIIGIVDINSTFAVNNLTILPAGKTIEGDITSYVLDMSGIYVSFIYSSSTNNWRLLESPTASPTASIGKSIAMSIAFGG